MKTANGDIYLQDGKHVYVIKNDENGRVKIGITSNLENRLAVLMTQSGMQLTLVYYTNKLDDARSLEREAHIHFAEKRYLGEWFDIDVEDAVEFVKSRAIEYSEAKIVPYRINGVIVDKKGQMWEFETNTSKKEKQWVIGRKKPECEPVVELTTEPTVEQDEYSLHEIDCPLTRFKSLGNNLYIKRKTGESFYIRYTEGKWMVRKLTKEELIQNRL